MSSCALEADELKDLHALITLLNDKQIESRKFTWGI